ncbi:STAS-like domain-containing protein [Ramlibacter rhizophilus]|uniref:DUF4325 domain-containing protein n=1 Tax=Ramlibacter rhizophilus TaxID=1781167 RepID=A0A4Z0BVQ2_9BURK|nr:STAS-like domain-containing protein [Ramlibacter rhizophilus]TFZ03396.1 DUF4325 domain-containing protein [Ramlibacter rhizophilus]
MTEHYYLIKPTLEEHSVWERDVLPVLQDLPENVTNTWSYCFTEMFNNSMDHSEGTVIWSSILRLPRHTRIIVGDDGEGIFRRIQRLLGLSDPRESLFELSKGKLTTDPSNHSGEGIFFSSRLMDTFSILSRGLVFVHDARLEDDWLVRAKHTHGTAVIMELSNSTTKRTVDVFSAYESDDGDLRFNRTVVPVRLAKEAGHNLVSRSQAKRFLARIDRFEHAVLDFAGVTHIGQGFADQVFRVFALQHQGISLDFVNASPEVERVIRHVTSRVNPPTHG